MSPRRIAYVLKIFPKVSETFIAGELSELKRRGVALQILSLLPPREELRHELITANGLDRLVHYQPDQFEDLVRSFRPELIHAHFATESTAVARQLATKLGVPFSFTAHGYDIRRKPPLDFAERAAAAGAVVTVSQANADYIWRTFGVLKSRLRVIPSGVDLERFRPAESKEPGGRPLIVCVARLVPVKNLGLLLRACAVLNEQGLGFRCVIVGEGPERGGLERLRAQLKLEEIVEMPGAAAQDEVVRWWQLAQVGVLSSEQEGMPVSLMEAAACGVPVVATAVGGVPELVEEEATGLLVPPGDAARMAEALGKLLTDAALRARMAFAARRRADEQFSLSRQADRLLGVWSEMLEGAH